MKVGDRVMFRDGRKAWKRLGLGPEPIGHVVEVYRDPEPGSGGHKVDVKFDSSPEPQRAINAEDLEVGDDEQIEESGSA